MADANADDLTEIREKRLRELQSEMENGPTTETPGEPVHVDGEDGLDDVVGSYDVVLVDFYADWCGPCKMLEPTVESIATETDAAVAKVDVDANQGLAGTYGVQGIPTMLLFADGEPVERIVGVRDEPALVQLIENHL